MNLDVILFDLHHTLTAVKEDVPSVVRRICMANDIDLSIYSDEQLESAFIAADTAMKKFQLENNVDSLWGGKAEDWLPFDRVMFEHLGLTALSDEIILKIEEEFKYEVRDGDYEFFRSDSLETINELRSRGYRMGICTRRHDNPHSLIERSGLLDLFETVQWSGVIGYAKPSPYTLLVAAKEMGINPQKCAYVGNYVNADVEAAIRCEMKSILLTWANPNEGPKAPNETIVLETPLDLLQVFSSRS
ncbi:MAG: HAD family hydrolase [Candidatus Thorarchaeota archaeon]|nr:HAD family hydrolase [Candidatus Thorarchaeota archaeon]